MICAETHQGLDNRLLTPQALTTNDKIRHRKELGGLLNYYYRGRHSHVAEFFGSTPKSISPREEERGDGGPGGGRGRGGGWTNEAWADQKIGSYYAVGGRW